MADVRDNVDQIRQAIYGIEVRESIASGIEAINAEVESTTQRQAAVEEAEVEREAAEAIRQENEEDRVEEHALRLAEVNAIKDAYDAAEKANLSVEVSNARTSTVKSKTFGTLKERLEESEQEAAAHWADIASAHGIDTLAKKGWGETYDAVLQNGWSGTLKYAKNDIGEVWLAGYITVGTVTSDTTITAMPEGYYPLSYTPSVLCFRVDPRKIIPGLYISVASKELRIVQPASDDLTAGQYVYVHAIYRTV